MTVKELRAALDGRKIGAEELTREYLHRINKDTCNCYITVCEDEALIAAKKAQKLIDSGKASVFTGIPVSVKDNICTKGIRTTCASQMLKDFVPSYDAAAVERLKNQGCVIVGKTNMDEFGMGSESQNSYFGGVKNPIDNTKVPGGSSGGSAAAVKSKLCAISLGSDTGGSVRQPAGFCGVVGFKPTYGTISRYGLIAFASSLDQIGILSASAEDAGLAFDAISGKDERDMTSISACECKVKTDISMKGMRIGIIDELLTNASDDVVCAVMKATEAFSSMGAEIVSCHMPTLKYAASVYFIISSAEAASNLGRFDGIRYGSRYNGESYEDIVEKSRSVAFGEQVKRRIELGNYVFKEGQYAKACQMRSKVISEYNDIFSDCELVLSPSSLSATYGIDHITHTKSYMTGTTETANLAGLPSISVPCGFDRSGMPVGLCITGNRFDDYLVIAAASEFERSM